MSPPPPEMQGMTRDRRAKHYVTRSFSSHQCCAAMATEHVQDAKVPGQKKKKNRSRATISVAPVEKRKQKKHDRKSSPSTPALDTLNSSAQGDGRCRFQTNRASTTDGAIAREAHKRLQRREVRCVLKYHISHHSTLLCR